MKKMLLSVSALFAVTIASAQSYPKQPDPSVVNVVYYKKEAVKEIPKKEETATQQPAREEKPQSEQEAIRKEDKVKNATRNAVAQNNKK